MSMPIEHTMPDPHSYTVVINERQRKLIRRGLLSLIFANDAPACEMEMLDSLVDMLDPDGSTGPLAPSPCINSFVL